MRIIIASLVVLSGLSACKKKLVIRDQSFETHSSDVGPIIQSGEWRGDKDQVDPTLGNLKTLD